MQIGVNHLGHFYLTYLLWPLIKEAQQPRVINVSALAHSGFKYPHNQNIPIDFNDFHLTRGYNETLAYSRSKVANILFTRELQKRMDQSNVQGFCYSLHPGVVRTEIIRDVHWILKLLGKIFYPIMLIILKSATEGAQTSLYLIHEDQSKLINGGYYSDCKLHKTSQFSSDMQNARKLWQISQKQLKITFKV